MDTTTERVVITVQMSVEDHERIRRAATADRRSVANFVTVAALDRAKDVIGEAA